MFFCVENNSFVRCQIFVTYKPHGDLDFKTIFACKTWEKQVAKKHVIPPPRSNYVSHVSPNPRGALPSESVVMVISCNGLATVSKHLKHILYYIHTLCKQVMNQGAQKACFESGLDLWTPPWLFCQNCVKCTKPVATPITTRASKAVRARDEKKEHSKKQLFCHLSHFSPFPLCQELNSRSPF